MQGFNKTIASKVIQILSWQTESTWRKTGGNFNEVQMWM